MLIIQGITKTYPNGVQALRGVDLTIGRGLFGLLGPNGAGKSTLMRTLATLQAPDAGTVSLDGRPVLDDPQAHRRALGYLPQDFGVYPGVSALELLDHLALLKGITDRRARRTQVDALLAQTNLWAHRKHAVSGFSGGMRQRFGIAQALLGDPRLVIVDEPTAGLDPEERNRFHNLLSEIGENVVVILSTHIVEDVRQLCPRMAILAGGAVVREGVPDALVDELHGRVWGRTVAKSDVASYAARLRVLSAQLHAGRTRLRVLADAAPDDGFEPLAPDLEDVYFAALGTAGAA
ncbi:ABC transporter related protein (plasmid) [Gemmatirosa kalamazoonensis]|uniref:ABC transporter related protein n=1 Tax=Gemmatirosa kalamazoonensis TaxID=861299 RepID=W0RN65_9BACT|nr:ABC transporter ATP-binding protein [Gemmatirosa kalamazoonensis]AHG92479.1 ABC transporter related protein [Gemmatirosa kalamazoonensis]